MSADIDALSPGARKFLHEEVQKWAKTVKAAGITPEQ